MLRSSPQKDYEYHGYVRTGGVDYKLFAYPDTRYPSEHRWCLKLAPLPAGERQVPA